MFLGYKKGRRGTIASLTDGKKVVASQRFAGEWHNRSVDILVQWADEVAARRGVAWEWAPEAPPKPRRPHKGGKPSPAPDGGAAARAAIRAWILAHEDDSDDLSAVAARLRRLPVGTLPPGWAPAVVRAIGARTSCSARLGEIARGERLPPAAPELAVIFSS